jgi:hypothetical protein
MTKITRSWRSARNRLRSAMMRCWITRLATTETYLAVFQDDLIHPRRDSLPQKDLGSA